MTVSSATSTIETALSLDMSQPALHVEDGREAGEGCRKTGACLATMLRDDDVWLKFGGKER